MLYYVWIWSFWWRLWRHFFFVRIFYSKLSKKPFEDLGKIVYLFGKIFSKWWRLNGAIKDRENIEDFDFSAKYIKYHKKSITLRHTKASWICIHQASVNEYIDTLIFTSYSNALMDWCRNIPQVPSHLISLQYLNLLISTSCASCVQCLYTSHLNAIAVTCTQILPPRCTYTHAWLISFLAQRIWQIAIGILSTSNSLTSRAALIF